MFDPTKPVRTICGLEARIIATDVKSDEINSLPIVALVKNAGTTSEIDKTGKYAYESVYSFRSDGVHPIYGDYTLVNIPEIVTRWLGVVRGNDKDQPWLYSPICETKELAEVYLKQNYRYEHKKIIEVKWEA